MDQLLLLELDRLWEKLWPREISIPSLLHAGWPNEIPSAQTSQVSVEFTMNALRALSDSNSSDGTSLKWRH